MNNLGFSNDNLHIGDVRIKGQDETIIIGNENGGNGYILPTEKGTEGQVITMNADNSTSFQDGGGSGNVLLGAGLGDDITVPYNSPALALPPSFVGTQRVTYGQLPIGGSIKYYLNSRFNLDIPSAGSVVDVVKISMTTTAYRANGTFAGIDAAIVNNNAIVDFSLPLSLPINFKGYLKVEGYITRTSSDTIKLTSTAFSKEYPGIDLKCQQWVNQAQPEEITISSPQPDDYIEFLWEIRNDYYTTGTISLIRPSIYWALQNVSDATVPPTLTSDHTQLTNLNTGDSGHSQFALLQGRAGGQLLSGGINASHFLTLKAHRFGLNNIVIKDLNTTFEKNIDMNQNQINDVSLITNTSAPLGLVGSSGTSAVVIDPDPSNSFNVLGQSDIKLQSNTDVILQSSTGFVDLNSNITRVIVGGITKLQVDGSETTSTNNINMSDNEIQNVGKITSSADLTLTPSNNVVCSTDLDMSNNSLLNGFGLNTQFLLASSQIETSQIISVGLGQQNYVANPHIFTADGTPATQQLEINNVELSSFKPLNMNNNEINNVSSINNLTPVGGLSSSTSNSAILTASTAEQSILGLTSVGSRTAPADTFKQGDAYTATLAGNFSSNNGDNLTLRLKGGVGATTTLSTLIVPLNASTNKYFELEINFVVRQIGVATTADLAINYDFSYNQNSGGNFQGERLCEINNTNFDTTINNELEITAQFSSTSANNSIEAILGTLGKNY